MSNSKNPFEIRLEILKMAQDMLNTSYQESVNLAWTAMEKTVEFQNNTIEDTRKYWESIKPEMYTPEQILEKANELYAFVTKKD